ncbi:hypothetical protein TCAL_16903 [Tigriopus californicus]|uniref:Ionotropic glutamate receptor L-glutamate and glycine-binding domain-containing protein n=1 Tax=Tigriopus californicus TaxID=6832 RepID=A0A553P8A3_TIGCA|nr:hypothetical protein TCAL_16903 [Tigriopus californicus]
MDVVGFHNHKIELQIELSTNQLELEKAMVLTLCDSDNQRIIMWITYFILCLVTLTLASTDGNVNDMLIHIRTIMERYPMDEIRWNDLAIHCQENCARVLRIHPHAKIIQDHNCLHQETIVTASLPQDLSFGKCTWIILQSEEQEQVLDCNIPPFQSQVYLLKLLQQSRFELWETYQVENVRERNLVQIWNNKTLLFQNEAILERRSSLASAHFNVIMAEWRPFQYIQGYDVENAQGFSMDLLKTLQSSMNFSYTLNGSEYQIQGDVFKNGSIYGLLGLVAQGQYDFGATVFVMSEDRSKHLNLLYVGTSITRVIISWIPPIIGVNDAILSMFNVDVWAVYAISLFLLTTYGSMSSMASRRHTGVKDHGEVGLAILGSLFGQGAAHPLNLISFRILLITAFLLGLMFSITFSARLISSLSVQKEINNLATLEQVEEEGVEMFIPGFGADLTHYSEASSDTVEGRLWQKKIGRSPEFHTNPYSLQALIGHSSKEAVALGYQNVVDEYRSRNPGVGCKLQTSKVPFFNGRLHFPFRPDFPYLEVFHFQLQKMEQSGIIDKLVQKWVKNIELTEEFMCQHSNQNEVTQVTFASISEF